MIPMATSMVRKNYTFKKNIIWKSGYQNFFIFRKILKTYSEWYTSVLGMEYLNLTLYVRGPSYIG